MTLINAKAAQFLYDTNFEKDFSEILTESILFDIDHNTRTLTVFSVNVQATLEHSDWLVRLGSQLVVVSNANWELIQCPSQQ